MTCPTCTLPQASDVVAAVARVTGLQFLAIIGGGRHAELVRARALAILVLREGGQQTAVVSRELRRSWETVDHALRKAQRLRDDDTLFRETVKAIGIRKVCLCDNVVGRRTQDNKQRAPSLSHYDGECVSVAVDAARADEYLRDAVAHECAPAWERHPVPWDLP